MWQDSTCLVAHVAGGSLLHHQAVGISKTMSRLPGDAWGQCAQILLSHQYLTTLLSIIFITLISSFLIHKKGGTER